MAFLNQLRQTRAFRFLLLGLGVYAAAAAQITLNSREHPGFALAAALFLLGGVSFALADPDSAQSWPDGPHHPPGDGGAIHQIPAAASVALIVLAVMLKLRNQLEPVGFVFW